MRSTLTLLIAAGDPEVDRNQRKNSIEPARDSYEQSRGRGDHNRIDRAGRVTVLSR